MFSKLAKSWWWLAAIFLTVAKLWLTRGQTIAAIGPAIHDDRLFLELAAHLLHGEWLGPYDQLTLAKGPFYPLWIAAVSLTGLPLRLAEQLAYVVACVFTIRALWPLLPSASARLGAYALLLCNPMSFEGPTLTRLLRQNIYTPLALAAFAGLIALILRRHESWRRQWPWALLLGFSVGAFWLTREESIWIVPGLALLSLGLLIPLPRTAAAWRHALIAPGIAVCAALLPLLVVSTMNYRHYDWFGTVEFRASEFKDAYGALARIEVGPRLPKVPVTRAAREAAYAVSPAFAELQPYLEGEIGDNWSDKEIFPAADRQMRGGWFMWALRDAVSAAGHARDAGEAMAFYRRIADEINAACDAKRLSAGPRRSGFLPKMYPEFLGEVWDGVPGYARYFATFESFTAYPSNSVGDANSVRIFSDLTHERLSPTAEGETFQPAYGRDRVDRLHQLGILAALVTVFLVVAAHLVWPIRLLQAIVQRRYSFPLLLATAAWGACAAYLVVNLLVHVTSFPNITPSAMAAAYPLLILFVIAVALDALAAWGGATAPAVATPSLRGRWAWIAGAAGIIFAARLREIFLFGTDVPLNDQWKIEAWDLLKPWLDGTLSPLAFFAPHYEHVPLWTRLLAWLEVVVTNRWDPLVQMTVNAALHASFVLLVVRWLCTSLDRFAALAVTILVIVLGAWPHAWENIAWGFQSQFPIALLALFLHVRGSFDSPPGSRAWWLAQAAGVAGLFTLASMWLAPLAIAAVVFWTQLRDARARYVPLGIAGLGLLMLVAIRFHPPSEGAFVQTAHSLTAFLQTWFFYLGWPAASPIAAVLLFAPVVILALQLRGRSDASAFDRIVLALGLWSAAQAAGLAYARGAEFSGFVSRYGELFAIGTLANGLALLRLFAAVGARGRTLAWIALLAWASVFSYGLQTVIQTGHTRFFHDHSAERNQLRREAIQGYLATGNVATLSDERIRQIVYGDYPTVARLLDQPAFRALLPHSLNAATPPNWAGSSVRFVQRHWGWIAVASTLALAVGVCITRAQPIGILVFAADRWRVWIVAGFGAASLALLLAWQHPFEFDQERRWGLLVSPREAYRDLPFEFVGNAPFSNDRLIGAAGIHPNDFRNYFSGTSPDGPSFTGVARSAPFEIDSPWLVVPYAGFPVGNGNALRVQVEDASGAMIADLWCPAPNPTEVSFWAVDVRAHQGRTARIWLYDGRTDTEAWVAAAPPIRARDAAKAKQLSRQLALERTSGCRPTLACIALLSALWLTILGGRALMERQRTRRVAAAAPARA